MSLLLSTTGNRLQGRPAPVRQNLFATPTPESDVAQDQWLNYIGGLNADVLTAEITNDNWSYAPAGKHSLHLHSRSKIQPQGLTRTTLAVEVTLLVTPYISAYVNPPNYFTVTAESTEGWPIPTTALGTAAFSIAKPDGSDLRTVNYEGISGNTFTNCRLPVFKTAVTYPVGSTIFSPGCHTGLGVQAIPTVPGREYAFIGRAYIERLADSYHLPGETGAPTGPAVSVRAGAFPTLITGFFEPFPPDVLGELHDPPITKLGETTWVMRRVAPPGCTLMIGSFGFGDGLWPYEGEEVEYRTAGWQLEDVTGMDEFDPADAEYLLPFGHGSTPGWTWGGTPDVSISIQKPGLLLS